MNYMIGGFSVPELGYNSLANEIYLNSAVNTTFLG